MQVKLAEVQRELKNSQTDLKDAKEIFRNQLGDAESETKELRDLIRAERDLLDRTMREHNAAVSDQLETQKRIEHSAMRREEALQRRLQQAEEDAENLRTASVPEAQIKRFRESALVSQKICFSGKSSVY